VHKQFVQNKYQFIIQTYRIKQSLRGTQNLLGCVW